MKPTNHLETSAELAHQLNAKCSLRHSARCNLPISRNKDVINPRSFLTNRRRTGLKPRLALREGVLNLQPDTGCVENQSRWLCSGTKPRGITRSLGWTEQKCVDRLSFSYHNKERWEGPGSIYVAPSGRPPRSRITCHNFIGKDT